MQYESIPTAETPAAGTRVHATLTALCRAAHAEAWPLFDRPGGPLPAGAVVSAAWAIGDLVHRPLLLHVAPGMPAERPHSDWTRRLADRGLDGCAASVFVSPDGQELSVAAWAGSTGGALRLRTAHMSSAEREVLSLLDGSQGSRDPIVQLAILLDRRDLCRSFFVEVRVALRDLSEAWSHVDDSEARRSLALILLCRLMFLFFVQRKGWLAGDIRFVQRLLLEPGARRIYAGRVRPLFFDALNRAVDERDSGPLFTGIPFLNGGLFAPMEEERRWPRAVLPDDAIRKVVRLLDRYRFVESEATREAAAIDPVMLGTVFEELMGTEQRGDTGAFYTPAPLVERVVAEALRAELEPRLGVQLAARATALRPLARGEALSVIDAIDSLRILDPACGTGAFLMGMLRSLGEMRAAALVATGEAAGASRAASYRAVIGRCLYGIDISATAVLLCELRLWLGLAAVMPDGAATAVQPLPNLGHRIRHGNALLGTGAFAASHADATDLAAATAAQRALVSALAEATGDRKVALERDLRGVEREVGTAILASHRRRLAEEAESIRAVAAAPELFGGSRPASLSDRARLRRIDREIASLEAAMPADRTEAWAPPFDVRIHFADVLADGGWDVVCGNPPWVRLARCAEHERTLLLRHYRWMRAGEAGPAFGAQADLSVAFLERAVSLARPGGVVAMLLPAKLLRCAYGSAARAGLTRETSLRVIEDLSSDETIHFHADAYPMLLVATRGTSAGSIRIRSGRTAEQISPADLPVGARPGDAWPLIGADEMTRLRALLHAHPPLGSRFSPRFGVKTGANEVFLDPPTGLVPALPCLRGSDIAPMSPKPRSRLLFCMDPSTGQPLESVPPSTARWISRHRERLLARADHSPGDPPWTIYRARPEMLGHRVVWRDIARRLEAAPLPPVVEGGPVLLNSAYGFGVPGEVLARRLSLWLNTAPMRFIASALAEPALGGHRRFLGAVVGRLPCPDALLASGPEARRLDDLALALVACPADATLWEEVNELSLQILALHNGHLSLEAAAGSPGQGLASGSYTLL